MDASVHVRFRDVNDQSSHPGVEALPAGGRAPARPPRRLLRHLLVQVHLWLGLVLSVVMAIWFVSGFFMMYSGYTTQVDEELRLERMTPLQREEGWISVERAARAAGLESVQVRAARLHRYLDRPVWSLRGPSGKWSPVDARSGLPLPPLSAEDAVTLARRFRPRGEQGDDANRGNPPSVRTLNVADVWTLTGTHEPAFPLYRVDLGDAAGTRVYVSRASGEVVNVHDRTARSLALAGAVVHYLYLPQLRRVPGNRVLWKWVVVALSALGAILCVSGLWIGILYLRSPSAVKARPHLSWSPYRGWMKWHHYTGLIFGLVSFTWVVSGMLSLNPGYTPNRGPAVSPEVRLAGGSLLSSPVPEPAQAIGALYASVPDFGLRELELRRLNGRPFWLARGERRATRLVFPPPAETGHGAKEASSGARAGGGDAATRVVERLSESEMRAILPGLVNASLADVRWISEEEIYYTSREDRRPLPVLRGQFTDASETWVYLDPATASVAQVSDRIGRWHRWGYSFLHGFDLPWLLHRRFLRDSLMIVFMAGGTALAITGVWTSVLWLDRGRRRRRRRIRATRRPA